MATPCPLCGCDKKHAAPAGPSRATRPALSEYSPIVQADLREAIQHVETGTDPDGRWAKLIRDCRKVKAAQKAYLARRTQRDVDFDDRWMAMLAAEVAPARIAKLRADRMAEEAKLIAEGIKYGLEQKPCGVCGENAIRVGHHGFGSAWLHGRTGPHDHSPMGSGGMSL